MPRKFFDVVDEPRHELLRQLIRVLARYCSSAMVVVRDDLGLENSGLSLLVRLEPHLLERRRCSSWPGTTLFGHQATTHRYSLRNSSLEDIIAASDGLYGWQQPALPEDLALFREDGSPLLVSIAHERDAYLEITDDEYDSLVSDVPDITSILSLRVETSAAQNESVRSRPKGWSHDIVLGLDD